MSPRGVGVADSAHNQNIFIQTIDDQGNAIDALSSDGSPTRMDDTEDVTGTAIADDGEVFITGNFVGDGSNDLAPGGFGGGLQTTSNSDDKDFFIISYSDVQSLGTNYQIRRQSGLYNGSDNVRSERSNDIVVNSKWFAVTGSVCKSTECVEEGFGLVIDRNVTALPQKFSDYTETFTGSGVEVGYSVDLNADDGLTVGGFTTTENIDFGGGPQNGGHGFVVSYEQD